LKIPQCFMDNTQTYLEKSSQIGEWFLEHYEKTNEKKDYVELAEVHEEFKNELDGLYQSMSRTEQAKWRKNDFVQHFINDPFIGGDYAERRDVKIGGKKTTVRNILRGWKKRIERLNYVPEPEMLMDAICHLRHVLEKEKHYIL
jgi:hypothetical protein